MSRQAPLPGILAAVAVVVLTGCHPQQPFYFHEDGDLSHYKGMATEIEYPDGETETIGEAAGAIRPLSLENPDPKEIWDLTLEEAVRNALANNKVMRSIGATISLLPGTYSIAQFTGAPESLTGPAGNTRSADAVSTVYDPAVAETDPIMGVEAALSEFDATFRALAQWTKIDEPRNSGRSYGKEDEDVGRLFPPLTHQDQGRFQASLSKTTAAGGSFKLEHSIYYSDTPLNVSPFRITRSDWTTWLQAGFRQPLLRGAGVQFNRIAGPIDYQQNGDPNLGFQAWNGTWQGAPGSYRGVMIARINTDIALVDFEAKVRNLVMDAEKAYWGLYMAYRELDAMIAGRDSALQTWRRVHALAKVGARGGEAENEAQAREQYFLFRSEVEKSLSNLYSVENNLRYLMGLAATDGRLIRPADEPTTAKVAFDWYEVVSEGLTRTVEIRRQNWRVKQRELELIAAKNYLLPRLDLVAMYQWQGLGQRLIDPSGGLGNQVHPVTGGYRYAAGTNAYQSMTEGDFQNWMLGITAEFPLGFRKEMAGVRHAQLSLARERAKLQEFELEVSHQLAHFVRDLEGGYVLSQTNFNRRIAAQRQVKAVEAVFDVGRATIDVLLKAQKLLADAEIAYYRALVGYNVAIAGIHYRKGSLLEYNGVQLAEGPWPGKAYFDAHRRARARDASVYLDYGYTRPKVISRGPYDQHAGAAPGPYEGEVELAEPTEAGEPTEAAPETIPTPDPEPAAPEPEPDPQARTTRSDSPEVAGARPAATTAAPKRAEKSYDVGLLKLERLAGKPAGKQSDPDGAKWSRIEWSDFESIENRHETVANPPAAETDRSASGWKRVQRRGTGAGL